MEETRSRRSLRNNATCVPMQNVFKSNLYASNSINHSIPVQILAKVRKFQSVTCDDINCLTFSNNQSSKDALQRMRIMTSLQQVQFSSSSSGRKRPKQNDRINSESHENDLGKMQLFQTYDRYDKYSHGYQYNNLGEEILYNQFFRNDLENIFLQ